MQDHPDVSDAIERAGSCDIRLEIHSETIEVAVASPSPKFFGKCHSLTFYTSHVVETMSLSAAGDTNLQSSLVHVRSVERAVQQVLVRSGTGSSDTQELFAELGRRYLARAYRYAAELSVTIMIRKDTRIGLTTLSLAAIFQQCTIGSLLSSTSSDPESCTEASLDTDAPASPSVMSPLIAPTTPPLIAPTTLAAIQERSLSPQLETTEISNPVKQESTEADPDRKDSAYCPPSPTVKLESDEEYEVEAVIGVRKGRDGLEYLVKWVGSPDDKSTWEPREHIIHAPEEIERYLQSPDAPDILLLDSDSSEGSGDDGQSDDSDPSEASDADEQFESDSEPKSYGGQTKAEWKATARASINTFDDVRGFVTQTLKEEASTRPRYIMRAKKVGGGAEFQTTPEHRWKLSEGRPAYLIPANVTSEFNETARKAYPEDTHPVIGGIGLLALLWIRDLDLYFIIYTHSHKLPLHAVCVDLLWKIFAVLAAQCEERLSARQRADKCGFPEIELVALWGPDQYFRHWKQTCLNLGSLHRVRLHCKAEGCSTEHMQNFSTSRENIDAIINFKNACDTARIFTGDPEHPLTERVDRGLQWLCDNPPATPGDGEDLSF
ncbi:hypothetical protein LTR97_004228 [Elasticomyces elasticus]|uniref:Chromo domain-containing protein n=1 Tax=Elasticomyces elasticus TaxID=574655 RepID=A0AAN7ZV11_9PEZI|nr:hypothetical protein LTR97_004228 [Elasticomyces elasticus]